MKQASFAGLVLGAALSAACGPRSCGSEASRTSGHPPPSPYYDPRNVYDADASVGQNVGDGSAQVAEQHDLPSPVPFASVPYRGLSLAGAEFAATIGGTFASNMLGTIPDYYYYPYRDWPNEVYYPGGYDTRAYPFFRSRGMNTIRLPFRWERLQRSLYGELDANELAHLRQTVDAMRRQGMYVLLDVHNYIRYATPEKIAAGEIADTVGSRAVPNEAFADLWTRLANEFKGDQAMLFGLMNEPFSIDDGEQWLDAANAAIAAIRKTGAKNLVLVCGNEFADATRWPEISDMLKDIRDPANNYAFEVHAYADRDGNGASDSCPDVHAAAKALEPFTAWAREHRVRGFLGEFAAGISVEAEDSCLTAIDEQLRFVERNADVFIGWTYWAGGQGFGTDNPIERAVIDGKNTRHFDVLVKHLQR